MAQDHSVHELQPQAEALARALPALLASAEHLAANLLTGGHGRRQAGQGDEFWQYRQALAGDPARLVDWRRSARSDQHFVREREWQAAQSVSLWVDGGQSMRFASDAALPQKIDRARLLGLALVVALLRGGERVGLVGPDHPPRAGHAQILQLAMALTDTEASPDHAHPDYATPLAEGFTAHGRAVFVSDFLGDPTPLEAVMTQAADRGVKGILLQLLDPAEEEFPYAGRTIFQSIGGSVVHETRQAGDLRQRYLDRLAARRDRLDQLSRRLGWQFGHHRSDQPPQLALLWLYTLLQGGR